MKVNDLIPILREKGFTDRDIQAVTGMSQNQIWLIDNGGQLPPVPERNILANYAHFRIRAFKLLRGEELVTTQ